MLQEDPPPPVPEDIAAFDATCTTPKAIFTAGETVCAKASGTFLGPRVIYWISPEVGGEEGGIVQTDIVSPTSLTATRTVARRGQWRLYLSAGDDGTLRKASGFSVSDAAEPSVDLSIHNTIDLRISSFAENQTIRYLVTVANNGPDAATDVNVSVPAPNNTTLTSSSQDFGPTCAPSGADAAPCTIASLAAGEFAEFNFVYTVNAGTTRGTEISNTASVASDTEELHTPDNSSATSVLITGEVTETECVLECPNDIVVSAGAPQNGQPGAVVNFGAAEPFGSCGSLTASPASGSFFPVGTTPVTVSSSSGGGGCSFNVTVVEAAPPTISCPASITVPITDACSTTVEATTLGTPTASEGTTVAASRSDGQPIGEPFFAGTTTVTWTATDGLGRIATCTQTVTVNVTETTPIPPSITAPDDLTLSSGTGGGACGLVVGEGILGRAEAEGSGCVVTVTRTGVPAGNFFPVGSTTVTWKATDSSGNTATDTQVVTIVENTPPSIQAPADLNFTCPSEVPAPNPALATGTDPNLPDGGPVTDNCGVPTVTVSDSTSGAGSAASPLIITRTYTATDAAGNTASSAQTITVTDPAPPTIALVGSNSMTHECHAAFNDPGVTTGDNCDQSVAVTTSGGFNPDVPGTYVITYTATDDAGNTASVQRTVTVVDTIAPVIAINGAATMTVECHTSFTDPGAAATDSCDTAVPVTTSGSVDVNTPGTYTLTYTAADDSGNLAAPVTRTVNVVDTTAPVMSCPADIVVYLPLNSTDVSMPVSFPAPTATDSCDASVPVTTSHASGSVFNVGTTTVTASAADDSGNSASCNFSVTVLYNFTGFFAPVNNLPTLNEVKAGSAVPVKFSLSGNKGLAIFAPNSPSSGVIPCDAGAPVDPIEETVMAGGSSLQYDAALDRYSYIWKTDKAWANTCRKLMVTLNDGSVHSANFKLNK